MLAILNKKVFLLLLTFILFGCTETQYTEPKTLSDWEPVTYQHIDQYFNKLKPEVRNSCEDHYEELVWDKDDMFEMKNWYVSDVRTDINYEWYHDGEYIHVDMYCVFDVKYMLNAVTYPQEEIIHYVSGFRMKKYYDETSKRLLALNFE